MRSCNRWLKWAFIEAAWVAIGCSAYFGGIYRAARARGTGANISITIVAGRMAASSGFGNGDVGRRAISEV